MSMTACAFLLPPMAGEKVTLNGFAFLGSLAYLIFFASSLPFHSGDMPIIGMYINHRFYCFYSDDLFLLK